MLNVAHAREQADLPISGQACTHAAHTCHQVYIYNIYVYIYIYLMAHVYIYITYIYIYIYIYIYMIN